MRASRLLSVAAPVCRTAIVNDWAVMGSILAEDFVLVMGKGRLQTRAGLLKEA